MFKNINTKRLNLSAWIVFILTYVLPFRTISDFESQLGFPFSFISIYDVALGSSPLNSTDVNIGGLALNIFLVYQALRLLHRFNHPQQNNTIE